MRNFALTLILVAASVAYGQQTGGGGGINPGGGGGAVAQTISALTYNVSDTTIVASWYTSKASDSHLSCGGKLAVDDGIDSPSFFHQNIVTGLTPATGYSCFVTSGATASSTTTQTTNAAATRTAITGLTFGTVTTSANGQPGDTDDTCLSNDGKTYVIQDDGNGFGSSSNPANMQLDVFSNTTTLAGTTVNALSAYGLLGTKNGTDGPSGVALSNKLSGVFCMGGNIYMFQTRAQYGNTTTPQYQYFGNVMKSTDHGATWNSWQNPTGGFVNGIPPNPLGSYQFATGTIGWVTPVMYANDDGTMGYTTYGNGIDGANAFIYLVYTDGNWNNGSNLYMMRWPRKQMEKQNGAAVQYYVGPVPASSTPTTFVNDSNWSSSNSSATAIYTTASQTSAPCMSYHPDYNEYVLYEWYQPSLATTSSTMWVISAAPTPVGPWTQIATQSNSPTGWYNECPNAGTVSTNVNMTNSIEQWIFTGDYGNSTYYKPQYESVLLNPLPLVDATAAATFAGSFAHQLKASYSGPLINVQRLSDSTNSDIGQTAGGLLNTTTLATFCSGTTCAVATVYDQSGNGNNLTQATYAHMPVIYTGGAVVTNGVNGRPAGYWNSTGQSLSGAIAFSGASFESVGVGTINSGAVSYSGLAVMTNNVGSGGSSGNVGLLGRDVATQQVQTIAGGACSITYTSFPAYGTQFEWNSYDTLTSGQACGVSVNGGTYSTSTASASPSLNATTLLMGADYPPATYGLTGYISDLVVYSSFLTAAQRATAHSVESFFYGTP